MGMENSLGISLTQIGLILDIFGVCLLFFTTSTKYIEAELAVRLGRDLTDKIERDKNAEWIHPFSFEEHQNRLSAAEKSVKWNLVLARIGLGLLVLGFSLQFLDIWFSTNC